MSQLSINNRMGLNNVSFKANSDGAKASVEEDKNENNKMSKKTKLMIGAAALAALAIGGVLYHKNNAGKVKEIVNEAGREVKSGAEELGAKMEEGIKARNAIISEGKQLFSEDRVNGADVDARLRKLYEIAIPKEEFDKEGMTLVNCELLKDGKKCSYTGCVKQVDEGVEYLDVYEDGKAIESYMDLWKSPAGLVAKKVGVYGKGLYVVKNDGNRVFEQLVPVQK